MVGREGADAERVEEVGDEADREQEARRPSGGGGAPDREDPGPEENERHGGEGREEGQFGVGHSGVIVPSG